MKTYTVAVSLFTDSSNGEEETIKLDNISSYNLSDENFAVFYEWPSVRITHIATSSIRSVVATINKEE